MSGGEGMSAAVFDVSEADFEQKVVERSREIPVVVDFWAEWCGPCRALGPLLERAAAEREGKVELAKLDTDANPALAGSFGIRGIPAVKAFRDGEVVSEFVGALPSVQVERFFDALVPTEADELAATGDEAALRRALETNPSHPTASTALAKILLARGDTDEALLLVEDVPGDFLALGLAARAKLTKADDPPTEAFAAWDRGDHAAALEALQAALAAAPEPDHRDLLRQAMVGIFEELGPASELAREHRRRLASTLN